MSRLNSTLEPLLAPAAGGGVAISPAVATTRNHPSSRRCRAGPIFDLVATTTGVSPIEGRRDPVGLRPTVRPRGRPILSPLYPDRRVGSSLMAVDRIPSAPASSAVSGDCRLQGLGHSRQAYDPLAPRHSVAAGWHTIRARQSACRWFRNAGPGAHARGSESGKRALPAPTRYSRVRRSMVCRLAQVHDR